MTTNQKHILVVDDDVEILKLANKILRGAGFSVSITHSPQSAREQMRNESPHLIISDLNMEPEDGYSFISSVRKIKEHQHTPIIVLSALNEFSQVKKAMTLGISDYAVKPLNAAVLINKIYKVLPGIKKTGWTPPSSQAKTVDIELGAWITDVGELGYRLSGPVKISPEETFEIDAPDLKLQGLGEGPQESAGHLKVRLVSGHFINDVRFSSRDRLRTRQISSLLKLSPRS